SLNLKRDPASTSAGSRSARPTCRKASWPPSARSRSQRRSKALLQRFEVKLSIFTHPDIPGWTSEPARQPNGLASLDAPPVFLKSFFERLNPFASLGVGERLQERNHFRFITPRLLRQLYITIACFHRSVAPFYSTPASGFALKARTGRT